jgi:transposase
VTWYERYGNRFEKERFPKAKTKQIELAEQIGTDGWILFQKLIQSDQAPTSYPHDAIQILRQVWLQNYYIDEQDEIRWRRDDDTPPAGQSIYSPYDPEARAGKKRSTIWVGYKAHMTETCDENHPHLIVHVETTNATVPDHALVETIHTALDRQQSLPSEHFVDTGYVDALNIVTSQQDHQIDLLGPVMPDTQWQALQQTGYDLSQFGLDWQQQQATCPEGKTSLYWHEGRTLYDDPVINIRFSGKDCHPCPARQRCTRSKVHGRALHVRPKAEHEALQQRREQQQTEAFKEKYKKRAGVEGTISQGVRLCDVRRSRYIGLAKTHLQHIITAAALNLIRVVEWLKEPTLAKTPTSRFARLAP